MIAKSSFPIGSFLLKRFFRLMPLFMLATLATVILSKKEFSSIEVILNLTGLFSLFDYDGGIATGSWSIGNEWIYYLMLPTLLLVWHKKNQIASLLLWALSIFCMVIFGFNTSATLAEYWSSYIHPLNHLLFFVAGSAMGYHQLHKRPIDWKIPTLGAMALIVFCMTPVLGDRIGLVSQMPRITLTLCTIIIAIAWYRINIRFWHPIEVSLIKIGDWSYSIYMLHPLIWSVLIGCLKWLQWDWTPTVTILFAVSLSICASAAVYRWFELPMMQWCQQKFLTQSLAK